MKCESHSAVSDSLQPHGVYNSWNSLGQNTGVGRLSLLQGIFPGIDPGLPHCRQILYQMSHNRLKILAILLHLVSKFAVLLPKIIHLLTLSSSSNKPHSLSSDLVSYFTEKREKQSGKKCLIFPSPSQANYLDLYSVCLCSSFNASMVISEGYR